MSRKIDIVYDILVEIKKACMYASYVIMTYTFLIVILYGRMTWSEPNNLILYTEGFFLVLSWIGLFWSSLKSLQTSWRRRYTDEA